MKVEDDQYTLSMSKCESCKFSTMLEFYPDHAQMWAGPFQEKFAFLSIDDCRSWPKLYTLEELRKKEEEFVNKRNRRLLRLNPDKRARKAIENYRFHWHLTTATVEFPFRVYICGNDDVSYSKFFATLEEAQEHVDTLIACQPLTERDIKDEYSFTN